MNRYRLLCSLCAALLSLLLPSSSRAADAEQPQPLTRIAVGSCARQDKPQPIWEAVLKTQPEVFVFLGDNIYGDTEDMAVLKAKYGQLAAVPGFAKLRESCKVLATWDDHDYGANDAGAEYPMKRESQQIFVDFWQDPPDSPRRKRDGVYDAHVFGPPGKRVQIILLDTRYFRSPIKRKSHRAKGAGPYEPNHDDISATILGDAQWVWLEEQLRQPAEVRLICSSIQVISAEHGWEKWDNHPHERERLFNLLRDTGARGVLFVSGDRHTAELSQLKGATPYRLYDLTASSLNNPLSPKSVVEPNANRFGDGLYRGANFGLVRIDWTGDDPVVQMDILGEDGETVITHTVRLSELREKASGG